MNEQEMKKLKDSAIERIWLVPGEDVDGRIGYLWCDCPTPSEGMEESEAVGYVRADIFELEKSRAELNYKAFLREEDRGRSLGKRCDELDQQLSAAEENIRGFPSLNAVSIRDKRVKVEALDELIDSLTEVGGEITIKGIQGYRDALARSEM